MFLTEHTEFTEKNTIAIADGKLSNASISSLRELCALCEKITLYLNPFCFGVSDNLFLYFGSSTADFCDFNITVESCYFVFLHIARASVNLDGEITNFSRKS